MQRIVDHVISLFSDTDVPRISYDIMKSIEIGKTIELCPGIFVTRKKSSKEGTLVFYCKLSPESTFELHTHDKDEHITVIDGWVGERNFNLKDKRSSDEMIFRSGTPHKVYTNKEGAELLVKFSND